MIDISSAIATINAMIDFNKLVSAGKIDDAVREKSAELTFSILSLQQTVMTIQAENQNLMTLNHELLGINRELKEKFIKMSDWSKEARRYELVEMCLGTSVFALKKNDKRSEPFHYLCPYCYREKKKSIIQRTKQDWNETTYECFDPACKAVFRNINERAPLSF